MESIGALSKKLSDYLDPKKVKQVNKAYNFACEAHSGQFRSSGDPYVTHPIAVASILSSFRMDEDSLSAAMLHDVIEDTGIPKSGIEENLAQQFFKWCSNDLKLNIIGLMCIPPFGEPPEPFFKKLRNLCDQLNLKHASMGMSNDFESAIEHGATFIRVGTRIFGERS